MSKNSQNIIKSSSGLSALAIKARSEPYLQELNEAQRVAVETLEGPVLMLAGAGTGKTKALTARIVHLLNTSSAKPNEILAVTFTNKAALEMKNRVAHTLGRAVEGMPWLGTFHSICVKLLRRHAELVNLKNNFTILDTDDQLRLLKQLIKAADVDEKRWPPRHLASLIDRWKNRGWLPEAVPASEANAFDNIGTELYVQYQQRLRELNAVDFGDLILLVVELFQENAEILSKYQKWFKYILVDEYQDTNVAQYLWLRLLAQNHKNICCVGDDDQSIYGWRGAEVGNILRFDKDFVGAKIVRLEQNYRSTPHILAAASAVISGNKDRLGKNLWTENQEGQKVRLIGHWDGEEEARWIGEEIESIQLANRNYLINGLDEIAILVRASHQMRTFEDRFLTIGLPYRVIGGPRFYERMEIRDAMAYFRLSLSLSDDLAFERIVNTPKRGIGEKAQQKIQQVSRDNGISLAEGARLLLDEGGFSGKAAIQLDLFLKNLDRWGSIISKGDSNHVELAGIILDESGYTEMWQNDKTPEAGGRLENLKELVKALEEFENLQGFLEHVSLIMENDSEEFEQKVSIMTLHAAKGLEFPIVFLPGWEDGLFPSQRSMDESGVNGLEEERRLAYVGITRSEQACYISFAGNRRVFGQWQSSMPSRFIDELPEQHVDILTPSGLYSGPSDFGVNNSTLDNEASQADGYDSPGWRRLQKNKNQHSLSQPSESKGIIIDSTSNPIYEVNERVFHQKFGYGTVLDIEGDKLQIEFEKAGLKRVVSKFVCRPEDIL